MGRRFIISMIATLLGLAGCQASNETAVNEDEQNANGRIGSHGMVLFGDKSGRAYLSHIPVFGPPHDVQLLLEIELITPAANLPATFSDRPYTFLPDRLSLDALRLGTLRSITGKVFLGNFEQGGTQVATGVKANVTKVIHQHELKATETQTSSTYFLLGTPEKAFAVHRIAGSPSFDHVLAVELGTKKPTADALAAGIVVTVAGARDDQASRLATARAVTGPAVQGAPAATFDVARVTELSCLEGPEFASNCR
jgi:hypothetical protein